MSHLARAKFRQEYLERVKFYVAQRIAMIDIAACDVMADACADTMTATIAWTMAGKKEVVIDKTFAVDWWSAFKERWFPKWAKRRWPPIMRHIVVNKSTCFPSIKLPSQYGMPIVIMDEWDRTFPRRPSEGDD